jgi:putative flavoprotein involved in K+ transport
MSERVNTIIVGGGQAGLALSYCLQQLGHEAIVLEAADKPAYTWRDQRWDSFTLVTPNWSFLLPGAEYEETDRNGFMPRDEVVKRIEQYVEYNHLPIQYQSLVKSVEVEEDENKYAVMTDGKIYLANNVIIATGLFQRGKKPSFATDVPPDIAQIYSGEYKNPQSIEPGPVLVVGSAQSGAQIAEELQENGRKVYLCVSNAGRVPRRYRGRDIVEWLQDIGFFDRTINDLTSTRERFRGNPHVSGKNGGHTINLNILHHNGMTLLGHLRGVQGGKLIIAPDLKESLEKANQFESGLLERIDQYIEREGLTPPEEHISRQSDAEQALSILELDVKTTGIKTIIWACGYSFDFGMVKLPVLDETGFPITARGVTRFPGLYFFGLPWMDRMKTGLFLGVKESAEYLAEKIVQTP